MKSTRKRFGMPFVQVVMICFHSYSITTSSKSTQLSNKQIYSVY